MKYIKVDKDQNIVAYLSSDIAPADPLFIPVADFPDRAHQHKYLNGQYVKSERVDMTVSVKEQKIEDINDSRLKKIEDRLRVIEDKLAKLNK